MKLLQGEHHFLLVAVAHKLLAPICFHALLTCCTAQRHIAFANIYVGVRGCILMTLWFHAEFLPMQVAAITYHGPAPY